MAELYDLGDLVPPDIIVELGAAEHKQRFTLPGDPPMETYARLLDMQQKIADAEAASEKSGDTTDLNSEREILDATFNAVFELFRINHPDLSREELERLVGIHASLAILNRIMGIYQPSEPETPEEKPNGDRPTKARKGKGSTRSKKNSKPSVSPDRKPTSASAS